MRDTQPRENFSAGPDVTRIAAESDAMIGQARLPVSGFLLAVALLAAACSSGAARPHPSLAPATSRAGVAGRAESQSPAPVTRADAKRCPVTLPRAAGPPGVSQAFFGWGSSYGNGKLWVGGLWPLGVIVARKDFVAPDGSVRMKFGWWRKVSGRLSITGRRLGAPAPPARGDVPPGYGLTGFQASGVYFPAEGCWEITGKVGKTILTFVTFVIKRRAW
jgi:hypothetical protein